MTEYLLYFLIIIVFYHFIYEGILAPSLRLKLRFDLFKIRDRLRNLKHEDSDVCSDEVFAYLQDSINNGLRMLHKTDLIRLVSIDAKIEKNPVLQKQIQRRREALCAVIDPDVQECMKDLNYVARTALLVNSGGWYIYLVPIALIWSAFDRIKEEVRELLAMPEAQFEKVTA